ncbi:single-stranded DNA-binding protein [Candidatus Pacearchaeota archaeon]|nr:single-stranded DNA-binding protein [Candidatus Pacearchaeota archaeon]
MSLKNLCVFSGRVGQDPEMRYLPDGTAMVTFGLASRRSWPAKDKNEDGSLKWNEETTWIDCVAFGSIADRLVKKVQKGTQLAIQSEYTKRKATTETGEERTYHNFKIFDFETGVKALESAPATTSEYDTPDYGVSEPEDIPF